MRRTGTVLVALLVGFACAVETPAPPDQAPPDLEILHTPDDLEGLPFSPAVRTGSTIYLSGQIGNLPGTRTLAEGGVAGQTRQALANIERVLTHVGSAKERIVKCTVFLENIADYSAMNGEYAAFFGEHLPARSTVAGSGLALGAKVEIECTALSGA